MWGRAEGPTGGRQLARWGDLADIADFGGAGHHGRVGGVGQHFGPQGIGQVSTGEATGGGLFEHAVGRFQ